MITPTSTLSNLSEELRGRLPLTKITLFAFNWTDPTTWYSTSTYVAGETTTDGGDHTTYSLANDNVIDSYHGKIMCEDYLIDANSQSYRVNVYLNAVKKVEQDPHTGTGGDYTINYTTGDITFFAANQESDVVTCDYHFMVNSTFILAPPTGKSLIILSSKALFTTDVVMNDSVISQPYGFVDIFAPELMPDIPTGTKIPLGNPIVYKTMGDFANDADSCTPTTDMTGGSGWRGQMATQHLNWHYAAAPALVSASGMEIRISLQHNTKFGGTFGSATFYCATN